MDHLADHGEVELSAFHRWLVQVERRWGTAGFVLAITAVSTVASLVATLLANTLTKAPSTFADFAVAFLVPLIVAPLASGFAIGLISRLGEANRRLHELANVDPLTGAANRRGFFRRAAGLLADGDWLVAMVDIDRFKDVNDRHGHDQGDRALVAVAERLRRVVGPGDLVGRLGGDEFVLLVARRDGDHAVDVDGLRLRLALSCTDVEVGEAFVVQASFGAAAVGADDTLDTALARADRALYEAKAAARAGRQDEATRAAPATGRPAT